MLVGRARACALRLDERHVSGEHATLMFRKRRWAIRDLGSSNGTFVDGKRLVPGEALVLELGARIAFGREDDPWVLEDDGPPSAFAEQVGTGAVRTATSGILALPDEASPELVVFADSRGRWLLEETEGEAREVADGAMVEAGGASWRVRVPEREEGTAAVDTGPSLDTIRLGFAVSRDEEHVEITVVHRGREIHLEAREHNYVLLTLARARLEDAHLPLSEQGWLDRDLLLRMLALDANSLNVATYRARNQLSAAGVDGAAGVVQVRRGQRRIGLEPSRLEVGSL